MFRISSDFSTKWFEVRLAFFSNYNLPEPFIFLGEGARNE